MRITNELKTRQIDFIKLESLKEYYPSHRLEVRLKTENIESGFNNFIWLSDSDIDTFLVELDLLDSSRKGEAVLESMSPGEMKLTFKSIDKSGHLSVTLHLVKEDRLNNDYSYNLEITFQIDPTSLPLVRRGLEELINKDND
jgi:hypothetical protein